MAEQIFNNLNEQFTKVQGPARDAAKLGVDHLEQVIGLQLEAARNYAETAVGEARGALEVSDSNSLQSYLKRQQELAQTLGQQVNQQAEQIAKLNQDFMQSVQKLAQQSLNGAAK